MFEKASEQGMEPCGKQPECPYGGLVPTNSLRFFCDKCIDDMNIDTDKIVWEDSFNV